jgi:hypothetical protein
MIRCVVGPGSRLASELLCSWFFTQSVELIDSLLYLHQKLHSLAGRSAVTRFAFRVSETTSRPVSVFDQGDLSAFG